MAEGNRKDPRARVLNMTVRYKSATVDEFIENHSHDISRGGIFIKTRSPFPAGTLLKFEVRIAEDQKLMQGVGRVVWRRDPERAEENYPAGMGIKFIKTGEGAAELISQIVAARQGAESSFDAGVRESGVPISGPSPTSIPVLSGPAISADSSPARASGSDPVDSEETPALAVESGPRGWTHDAETTVSSPPKKRPDQAPDKRKVVLQGPALEAPPSSHPKAAATVTIKAEDRAPARAHSPRKGSLAEETTSPRVRPAAALSGAPQRPASPSVYGLVAIVAALTLGVVLLNRVREDAPAEEAPASPVVAAPTPPPVVAKPAPEEVTLAEPAVIEADPEPAVAATDPEPAPAAAIEAAAPAATPRAVVPTSPAPTAPAASAASRAPSPAPSSATAAASKPSSAPVATKIQPAPVRPAPPAPPKPAPAEPPREAAAPPPVPKSEPPASQPAEQAPAAAASAEKAPAEKKKPAATAEARPREATSTPSAPPPAAPAPSAPPPAGDDNPY